jgi:hypothetical protein
MNKKNTKKILYATAACLVLTSYLSKKEYHPKYTILNEENGPFASYSNGLVYIGDKEYLSSLKNVSSTDILIRDERDIDDPNIAIINSYNIGDKEIRNEILEIIYCYEIMYPTEWDRSIESMRLEWYCHNVSYFFNYRADEAKEVDLNNADEDKYNNEVLRRILRL